MSKIDEIIDSHNTEMIKSIIETLIGEVLNWKWTEKDNGDCDVPMTKDQMEWYNKGVESVADMLDALKDGQL